ncbi:MAG: hypothetical protein Q8M65_05655 [Rhodoglobus sp.]|nr:hypothetical protein [Rhodoglobus sp.]
MSSQDRNLEDPASSAATVPVALTQVDDVVRMIALTVVDLDDAVQEISVNGQVIGFIHTAGRVFVALTGTRTDRAEECGQSILWDCAAETLVITFEQLHQPQELAPRSSVPEPALRDTREAPRRWVGIHSL